MADGVTSSAEARLAAGKYENGILATGHRGDLLPGFPEESSKLTG